MREVVIVTVVGITTIVELVADNEIDIIIKVLTKQDIIN